MMNNDRGYMKEAAKTLHLGCVAKFKTDKYGHFDCDCSLCNRHYDRCELEDTAGFTPQDWGVK